MANVEALSTKTIRVEWALPHVLHVQLNRCVPRYICLGTLLTGLRPDLRSTRSMSRALFTLTYQSRVLMQLALAFGRTMVRSSTPLRPARPATHASSSYRRCSQSTSPPDSTVRLFPAPAIRTALLTSIPSDDRRRRPRLGLRRPRAARAAPPAAHPRIPARDRGAGALRCARPRRAARHRLRPRRRHRARVRRALRRGGRALLHQGAACRTRRRPAC
jgi:hypothetical protein